MALTDQAARTSLRAEVSAEFFSSPQRYLLGADEEAFTDDDGKQEFIDKMLSVMPNWIIVVMAIVGIIGAYIGCSIGMAFLKKHFKKTGMEK